MNKQFILSIALAAFAVNASNIIMTLLLPEIASTVQVSEGLAVQLKTGNFVGELAFAILMIISAFRMNHKLMFMSGLSLVAASAFGSFLATNFVTLAFFSFLEGSGTVMVTITTLILIGDLLPSNMKAKAVGGVMATGFISNIVGNLAVVFLANIGGWRLAFLLFPLPTVLIALVVSKFSKFGFKNRSQQVIDDRKSCLSLFKQVFFNKSAAACLISWLLLGATTISVFIATFLRQIFLSMEQTGYVIIVAASIITAGSLAAGRMVNRFGAKSLTIAGAIGTGIFTILLFSASNLWFALMFICMHAWFASLAYSGIYCLALDQIPQSRDTMMPLSRLFAMAGTSIAPALGGALLVLLSNQPISLGYQAVGIALGTMSFIGAAILFFFTRDPNHKTRKRTSKDSLEMCA